MNMLIQADEGGPERKIYAVVTMTDVAVAWAHLAAAVVAHRDVLLVLVQ